MPLARRRVSDASALRALAHPLRVTLLETLVTEGPLTASQAAVLVGGSPSNCSWHLRKLAEHGFVREARGRTGRQRPWQVVSEGLEWGLEDPDEPDSGSAATGRLAAEAVGDTLVERELQRLRAAHAARDTEPAAWQEATGLVRGRLWLTAVEARELADTLARLASVHAERVGGPAARPPDARLVSLVAWLVPSSPMPSDSDSP